MSAPDGLEGTGFEGTGFEVTGFEVTAFKAALGRFATGITVVTTALHGEDHAMTANAFTSVSLEPPVVLVCVEKVARFHEAVLAAGVWGVSVLGEDGAGAASWFATRGRPLAGQFEGIPLVRGVTGVPLLAGALSTVEARTRSVHDGGDHTVVLGDALSFSVPAPNARPLVYWSGAYHRVGGPVQGRESGGTEGRGAEGRGAGRGSGG